MRGMGWQYKVHQGEYQRQFFENRREESIDELVGIQRTKKKGK